MRVLVYHKDTITVTRNNRQMIILSYTVDQVTKIVTSILYPNIKANTLVKLCKALNITRIYLDYNSDLYQTLSTYKDIQVFYKSI
jgi:hypothetical protein